VQKKRRIKTKIALSRLFKNDDHAIQMVKHKTLHSYIRGARVSENGSEK